MVTLICNELKKIISRSKNFVIIGVFAIFVVLIGIGSYKDCERIKEINDPKYILEQEESNLKHLKKMRANSKSNQENEKELDTQIKATGDRVSRIREEIDGKNVDWKEHVKNIISVNEEIVKDKKLPLKIKEPVRFEIREAKYLLDNDIKEEKEINAFKFATKLFMTIGTLLLAVVVCLISGDIVSGECTPPTMKFLLTQPVDKGKILLSKFIAVLLTSIVAILVVELIVYLIMGGLYGFGNMNYPICIGTKYEFNTDVLQSAKEVLQPIEASTYVVTRALYLGKVVLLQVLFITSIVSFAFMLSTIVKNSMISVSLSIVIIIGLTMLEKVEFFNKYIVYFITIYGNIGKLISGETALNLGNPAATTVLGMGVMTVWSVVCYVISHLLFTRIDIII